MKTATELNSILEEGFYKKHAPDEGYHPEAKGRWDYSYVLYHVSGKWSVGLTNIMNTDDGRRFYDITKIRELRQVQLFNTESIDGNSLIETIIDEFSKMSTIASAPAPRASANCFLTRC